jgi:hypothetical protein
MFLQRYWFIRVLDAKSPADWRGKERYDKLLFKVRLFLSYSFSDKQDRGTAKAVRENV